MIAVIKQNKESRLLICVSTLYECESFVACISNFCDLFCTEFDLEPKFNVVAVWNTYEHAFDMKIVSVCFQNGNFDSAAITLYSKITAVMESYNVTVKIE